MRYFYFSLLAAGVFLISCDSLKKERKSKYYISLKVKSQSLYGGGYDDEIKQDSTEAESDSAAYFDGAISYVSWEHVNESFKERGIPAMTIPISFDVYNEAGENIKSNLSPSYLRKVEAYINSKGNTDALTNPDKYLNAPGNLNEAKLVSNTDAREKEVDEYIANSLLDTAGLYLAPVKVLSSRLVQREYSSYKDIRLTYKNVSGKRISAIRFRWYGKTAFNDPADMGNSFQEGFGGGFDDDPLGIGKSTTSEWSILSKNAKKVVLAWPTEVAFEDGTKWELK
jgi:hypothetical protein